MCTLVKVRTRVCPQVYTSQVPGDRDLSSCLCAQTCTCMPLRALCGCMRPVLALCTHLYTHTFCVCIRHHCQSLPEPNARGSQDAFLPLDLTQPPVRQLCPRQEQTAESCSIIFRALCPVARQGSQAPPWSQTGSWAGLETMVCFWLTSSLVPPATVPVIYKHD